MQQQKIVYIWWKLIARAKEMYMRPKTIGLKIYLKTALEKSARKSLEFEGH